MQSYALQEIALEMPSRTEGKRPEPYYKCIWLNCMIMDFKDLCCGKGLWEH